MLPALEPSDVLNVEQVGDGTHWVELQLKRSANEIISMTVDLSKVSQTRQWYNEETDTVSHLDVYYDPASFALQGDAAKKFMALFKEYRIFKHIDEPLPKTGVILTAMDIPGQKLSPNSRFQKLG